MDIKCIVCGEIEKPSGCLSFHRFPSDLKRKHTWMKKLNIDIANKWHYVCSKHFEQHNFHISKSGLRILKSNAVPFLTPTLPTTSRAENLSDVSERTITASESSTLTASECEEDISYTDQGNNTNIFSKGKELKKRLTFDSSSSSTQTASESYIYIPVDSQHETTEVRAAPKTKQLDKSSSSTQTASESNINISSGSLQETTNVGEPPQKKRKVSRRQYVGDITSGDLSTPRKAKRSFNLAKVSIAGYRKKIDVLQRKNRRMKSRVTNLKTLLSLLKEKHLISENAQESIEASLSGPAAELVKRILKGSKSGQYSQTLRAFALTLHFYSPRAYNYVREKFNKSLPHPSTISKWYQKIDGFPGFTDESLVALKHKVATNKEMGKETFGNLVIDEMSIRKKIEWVGEKFVGYVDIGANLQNDSLPEAKEVLVFLITSINGNWKIPVGYFFLDGLSGKERANLVRQCLEIVFNSGVIITSLTFDGAASNISMANHLGTNFSDPKNLKTYFDHPVTKDKVFIFLDICHMIKLVRNCLGDFKYLHTKDGNVISWDYLTELVNLQCYEGLHAGSKLKRRHMQYAREKMKVKIATETFSKSVCDALQFLEHDLKLHTFQGARETANFCLLFNDVFDILNSRNKFSSYVYKKALSPETEHDFFKRFFEVKEYILGLTLKNKPILCGPRKTGFLGFLIGMESFKGLYSKYVISDTKLNFLLGYKFSQDHLETLFSTVRSLHGYNNNPTCRQFQSAYKKLLITREVRGADTANAVTLDNTLILNVSSRKITINDEQEDMELSEEYKSFCNDLEDHDFFSTTGWQLSSFLSDVIIYIAGFVVKSLKKCITCTKCLCLLETNETSSLLQKRKTYGNLVKASPFVSDICTWGEKIFRQAQNKNVVSFSKCQHLMNVIVNKTIQILPPRIFEAFGDHVFDGELLDNHQLSLIKLILKRYFTIRIHHETRKKSDEVRNRVRSILTHLILYQNQ